MHGLVLLGLLAGPPLAQYYFADSDGKTPVLPMWAVPSAVGGWMPPSPPSDREIRAVLARAGRPVGDKIISRRLETESVAPPRLFPTIGRAMIWEVNYSYHIVGPSGPSVIYIDRVALVRAP